jgi:hypothetical protein
MIDYSSANKAPHWYQPYNKKLLTRIYDIDVHRYENTLSWRVTKPLRMVGKMLNKQF